MMMKVISAAALTVALAVPSMAATVMNGSFEKNAGIAQDNQQFNDLATGSGNNSWSVFNSLPGWTKGSGAGIEVQTNNTLDSINAQDGLHYVELDSHNNSSMQQTINFSSTGSYLLSFFYSPRADGKGVASNVIDYSLVGAATILAGSVSGPSVIAPVTGYGIWTEITAKFVITQTGNYTLTFAATGKSDSYGGLIDNVSISAVPVPAAGFLLIGALGGLAALRRRKTV